MGSESFSLKELEALTGVPERTIRWYVSEGVLPRAESRGRDARYSRVHLERLLASRWLRDHEGLTISDIRRRMNEAPAGELRQLAAQAADEGAFEGRREPSPDPKMSTRELVSRWLEEDGAAGDPSQPRSVRKSGPAAAFTGHPEQPSSGYAAETPLDRLVMDMGRLVSAGERRVPRQARAEEWHRIPITPEIELAVKGSLGPEQIRRLERLADYLKEALTGGLSRQK